VNQKRSNGSKIPAKKSQNISFAAAGNAHTTAAAASTHTEWFSRFAHETAHLAGKPVAFIVAVVAVLAWAATGPLFGFSDTWQLVINTSTTIITFLMVFLIQHTQNRDTMALQVKLSELIIAVQGAKNSIAVAEDLSEEELERLHKEYCGRAEATLASLEHRRQKGAKGKGANA
jgi:low affinity Fe/Cu permease